jgi:putative transposase
MCHDRAFQRRPPDSGAPSGAVHRRHPWAHSAATHGWASGQDALVDLAVLGGGSRPAEFLCHDLTHRSLPRDGVAVVRRRRLQGVAQRRGRVVLEEEARFPVADAVLQATDPPRNGYGAVALRAHLGEAAGLVERGHQEQVRPGEHLMLPAVGERELAAASSRAAWYRKSTAKDQTVLRMRIRELALARPRFGYTRIWVLLRREGWPVNRKRVRRLYRLDGLQVRMRVRRRKHLALHRGPAPTPVGPRERWSMDFVHDALADGTPIRVLTVLDHWSRDSPILEVATRMSGQTVATTLEQVIGAGPAPRSITVDHGTEFMSRALEDWAWRRGVQLDFIRPGHPVENAYIESFNGKLRDECLNVHQFISLDDAKAKIEAWRRDYNDQRPRGSASS